MVVAGSSLLRTVQSFYRLDFSVRWLEQGIVVDQVPTGSSAAAADLRPGDVIEAEYRYPYLAHAAMEPLNCVIQHKGDSVEVWNGEQMQTVDQANVAALFGLKPEQVTVNMLYAGGSFGRRANPKSDYVLEAAHIVKALGRPEPVKMIWTREDDIRHGHFQAASAHRMIAGLDDENRLVRCRAHAFDRADDRPRCFACARGGNGLHRCGRGRRDGND